MSKQEKEINHFKILIAWVLVGFLAAIAPIPGSFFGFIAVVTPIWFVIWLGLLMFG